MSRAFLPPRRRALVVVIPACPWSPLSSVPCGRGVGLIRARPRRPLPPLRAGAGMIRHVQGVPFHGGRARGVIRKVQGVPFHRCGGALVVIPARPGRPFPLRCGLRACAGCAPVYGGRIYYQHAILEYSFSTSNDKRTHNSTRFWRKRKLAKFFRVNDNLQIFLAICA